VQKIAVLDFGGQYAHLIANRIRRLGVYTEIVHPTCDIKDMQEYQGIIYSGGPSSVYADNAPSYNPEILSLDVPKLGICYGHQLISQQSGGSVQPGKVKEYGLASLEIKEESHSLLKGLPSSSSMWMSHGDKVEQLAPGFRIIAETDDCDTAAVANDEKRIYGIQFHPEVTHSEFGLKLLENFLDICGCERNWNMHSYLEDITRRLQKQVGERKVFLLVSGGVDSTVAFVLLNKVLGKDRVLGLHIDNGMMRLNESQAVDAFLRKEGIDNLKTVDAGAAFLKPLEGVTAPEEKRKIIGDTFLEVKDQAIEDLQLNPDEWLLAQGTIYPDTIESGGTDNADLIKTHHNRVEAVMDLLKQGKIIEPLADLYKDEVRLLGEELNIPHDLVWRHPFPGPGLGVRLLCSDGSALETEAPTALDEYLKEYSLKGEILPLRSVGVQGDARTYAQPFLLQTPLSWDACEQHSTALTNRIAQINRLVYQIAAESEESPKLVEQYCTKEVLDILRAVDNAATLFLQEEELYAKIWQMPVVLLPLRVAQKPVIVLRPVQSSEAMTASFSRIDQEILQEKLWPALRKAGAGALYYDVTHKPPGTIEWE
jgi:GMP synthase (glutamine-hydrolysing)